jgi:hypothetical protein
MLRGGRAQQRNITGDIMNKSDTIKELSTALSKFQSDMPAVQMNSVNPFLKNKYADLGAMIETARTVLAENGLSVSQLVTSDASNIGIETVLMHSSGEWISTVVTLPVGDEKGKSLAQVAGSTITYMRRYSFSAILGLYADEDNDGNGHAQNKQQGQAKAGDNQAKTGNAQAKANGNGKPPPTRAELIAKFQKLTAEAEGLGIVVQPLPANAPDEHIITRGQNLNALILQTKNQPVEA